MVCTPVGDSIEVIRVVRAYPVEIAGYSFTADLVVLGILGFDVILGMDWLSAYQAVLNY